MVAIPMCRRRSARSASSEVSAEPPALEHDLPQVRYPPRSPHPHGGPFSTVEGTAAHARLAATNLEETDTMAVPPRACLAQDRGGDVPGCDGRLAVGEDARLWKERHVARRGRELCDVPAGGDVGLRGSRCGRV